MHIKILFTLFLTLSFLWVQAQNEFSDFTKVPFDSTKYYTLLKDRLIQIPKLDFKDTFFHQNIKNKFIYNADKNFNFSIIYQNVTKDSIVLNATFQNKSEKDIYVAMGKFISENDESIEIQAASEIFGLDCFTQLEFNKVKPSDSLSIKIPLKLRNFEKTNYNLYMINDLESLCKLSKYPEDLVKGVRADIIKVGVSNASILLLKGITELSVTDSFINDKANKVSCFVHNN